MVEKVNPESKEKLLKETNASGCDVTAVHLTLSGMCKHQGEL